MVPSSVSESNWLKKQRRNETDEMIDTMHLTDIFFHKCSCYC